MPTWAQNVPSHPQCLGADPEASACCSLPQMPRPQTILPLGSERPSPLWAGRATGEGAVIHRQRPLPAPDGGLASAVYPSIPMGLLSPQPIQGDSQGSPSGSSRKLRPLAAEPGPSPCHAGCEDTSVSGHLRLSRTGADPFSENHPLSGSPGPVLPCPGPQFPHLLNEGLDSVVRPVHPEVCGSRDSAGLVRQGGQWPHGGTKDRAILVKEGFVEAASANPRASLPTETPRAAWELVLFRRGSKVMTTRGGRGDGGGSAPQEAAPHSPVGADGSFEGEKL